MIRQTKRWIRDRMKQDTKKRVMIAKIVERPLDYMTILLDADNIEVANVWSVE